MFIKTFKYGVIMIAAANTVSYALIYDCCYVSSTKKTYTVFVCSNVEMELRDRGVL